MVDLEYVRSNIKEGFQLNPKEKVVNAIIKGINRCDGDCPCNNSSDEVIGWAVLDSNNNIVKQYDDLRDLYNDYETNKR